MSKWRFWLGQWGQRFCGSNKLSSDTTAAGPGTTLWRKPVGPCRLCPVRTGLPLREEEGHLIVLSKGVPWSPLCAQMLIVWNVDIHRVHEIETSCLLTRSELGLDFACWDFSHLNVLSSTGLFSSLLVNMKETCLWTSSPQPHSHMGFALE